MKQVDKHLVCALALICSSSALAAETITIEISGEVVPTSCIISTSKVKANLGKVATTNEGAISAYDMDLGSLNITCPSQKLVNMRVSSTAPASVYGGIGGLAGWLYADGSPVASKLSISPDSGNISLNGSAGAGRLVAKSVGVGGIWVNAEQFFVNSNHHFSVASTAGGNDPATIQSANIPLKARNEAVAASSIDWTKGPITANQILTFELVYP